MTSRELQIFMAVVEYGKMSEAARQLFITQSSVSQAITSIEKEYDIRLFERLANGLFLTAEGEALMAHGRSYFTVKNDMDEFLRNASCSHRLKVGATVTVGTCVISPILKEVKRSYEKIELFVSVANTHILEEMLLKSEIDVGLIEGCVTHPDLVSRNVIRDSLVLICPPEHRFARRKSVRPQELADEALILRELGSGTRALFEEEMLAMGLPVNVRWSCYNSEAIKNAVTDGHGVSVISHRLVEQDLRMGTLCACDIEGLELHRYFSIVYHKNKYFSDELKRFISECERFAEREAHP